MTENKPAMFKLFDMYDVSAIEIKDNALKPYMNFGGKLLVKSYGRRNTQLLGNTKVNLIERIANKHKYITSWSSGHYNKTMKIVMRALAIIEKQTGKNPIQVVSTAIENGSPKDEITVIEQGGARYPQAVDTSPIRRINLAVRWFIVGAYGKSFGKKKKIAETLAAEIINAYNGSMDSYAVSKRNETEKQADSAR